MTMRTRLVVASEKKFSRLSTSPESTAIRSPVWRSSKKAASRVWRCSYRRTRRSWRTFWARVSQA